MKVNGVKWKSILWEYAYFSDFFSSTSILAQMGAAVKSESKNMKQINNRSWRIKK